MFTNISRLRDSLELNMSFKVIILTILLATAYAGPRTSLSSLHKLILGTRIIDGKDAQVGEFPYIVSLQQGTNHNSVYHNCAGSIIANDWILTAAHCIRAADNLILLVKAGKHDLSKKEASEQVREISKRIVHEKYQGEVQPYDIALLKLKTPLKLNKRVAIVKLPKSGEEPQGQTTIAGWGSISKTSNKIFPSILKKAQVPVLDRATCQSRVRDKVDVTNVCTGTKNSGGSGICQGDSGGPLMSNGQLVGISSWVLLPCGEGMSVFTKVSDYIDWISNHMSD